MEAFTDDKISMAENLKFVLEGVENCDFGEKGENAGYQHSLLCHNLLKRLLSLGC